ncbi:MAG: hypothetical protein WA943_05720 [Parvibaculum sp.]|uniref:hypothetical protein n=1 Tax=Parvibaculum sp. TaxID=2024848 RepID=UPI003C70EB72
MRVLQGASRHFRLFILKNRAEWKKIYNLLIPLMYFRQRGRIEHSCGLKTAQKTGKQNQVPIFSSAQFGRGEKRFGLAGFHGSKASDKLSGDARGPHKSPPESDRRECGPQGTGNRGAHGSIFSQHMAEGA